MYIATCTRPVLSIRTIAQRTYSSSRRSIPYNYFSEHMTSAPSSLLTAGKMFPATPYQPKYDRWPYESSDFQRYDESDDGIFYRQPRLVTHIDEKAVESLTRYYGTVLPRAGRIMDVCTSWKSFYPSEVKDAAQNRRLEVYGVGLNAEEMSLNSVFQDKTHWKVMDLNQPPHDVRSAWPNQDLKFDAITCVVSIDYLNEPLEVCKKLLEATIEGGKIHLAISNRCFPNKVVRRWMMLNEQSRLEMVGGM